MQGNHPRSSLTKGSLWSLLSQPRVCTGWKSTNRPVPWSSSGQLSTAGGFSCSISSEKTTAWSCYGVIDNNPQNIWYTFDLNINVFIKIQVTSYLAVQQLHHRLFSQHSPPPKRWFGRNQAVSSECQFKCQTVKRTLLINQHGYRQHREKKKNKTSFYDAQKVQRHYSTRPKEQHIALQ